MRLLSTFLLTILAALPVSAQDSVIATLNHIRPAIVNVIAVRDQQYRQGAGVIIDPDGLIATNTHILKDSQIILVKVYNGKRVGAKLVSILPEFDVALIRIETDSPLPAIEWGDSSTLQRGQEIINIGNSFLNDGTLTMGHVRHLAMSISENDQDPDAIEVTIPLFKGDSGGPLFNRDGELIGLVTARHSRVYRSSFAITSNKVHSLYQCVKHHQKGCLILD